MKMFVRGKQRVRMATTIKAYMMLQEGATFDAVAQRYTKGNHQFLNLAIQWVRTCGLLDLLKSELPEDRNSLFPILGTEFLPLRETYRAFLDNKEGQEYTITYHYYTSHNTKSKSITNKIKAFSKQRAQTLLTRKVGGDAIITKTY